MDEIAPKLTARNSGYLRITKLANRRGDNTLMSEISFVDDLNVAPAKPKVEETKKKATPSAKPKKESK